MSVHSLFTETYFGSTLTQYVLFFTILLLGAILGRSIGFIYDTRLKRRADKTKTEIDDVILYALGQPVILLAVVLAAAVGQYVLTPTQEVESALGIAVEVLVIVLIAWTAIRLTDGLIRTYIGEYVERTKSKLDDALIPVISRVTHIGIVSIAGIVILDTVGYDVTAVIASFGLGGIAVAFASRRALTDLFGGVHIFSTKPFMVEDLVEIDGTSGQVEEIGLRTTQIRDFDGRLVTVPNSKIANTEVKNITSEPTRRVERFVELAHDTTAEELGTALELAVDAVTDVDGVEEDEVGAWFWEYGDWGLRIRVQYHITDLDRTKAIVDAVNRNIQAKFEDAGIVMAGPGDVVSVQGDR